MTVSCGKVLEDPRSCRLPAGFSWSRRLVGEDPVGKWCLMYDSRFVNIISPPPADGWTEERINIAVSTLRIKVEQHTLSVQLKMLNGPMAGEA